VAETIAGRERWRVRWWAAVTGGLWVVAAAYLLILVFLYLPFLNPPVHALPTAGA
jgi:hypothetical protein